MVHTSKKTASGSRPEDDAPFLCKKTTTFCSPETSTDNVRDCVVLQDSLAHIGFSLTTQHVATADYVAN